MIVDASAAVPVLIDHPMTNSARSLLIGRELTSPALVFAETANALWRYAVKGEMTAAQINASISQLRAVIRTIPDEAVLAQAVSIATTHRHPVYDCLYLALALERREPLATADRRMAMIARELHIETELVEPE